MAGRDAVIDEQPVLDVRGFTTWTPETWELLDLSEISFTEDKPVLSNKLFSPLAMIFSHSIEMRTKQNALHDQLWVISSSVQLSLVKLWDGLQTKGRTRFSADEAEWCECTLRILQMGQGAADFGKSVPTLPSLRGAASRWLIEPPSVGLSRSGRQVPVDGRKAPAEPAPAPRKRKDEHAEDGAGG